MLRVKTIIRLIEIVLSLVLLNACDRQEAIQNKHQGHIIDSKNQKQITTINSLEKSTSIGSLIIGTDYTEFKIPPLEELSPLNISSDDIIGHLKRLDIEKHGYKIEYGRESLIQDKNNKGVSVKSIRILKPGITIVLYGNHNDLSNLLYISSVQFQYTEGNAEIENIWENLIARLTKKRDQKAIQILQKEINNYEQLNHMSENAPIIGKLSIDSIKVQMNTVVGNMNGKGLHIYSTKI